MLTRRGFLAGLGAAISAAHVTSNLDKDILARLAAEVQASMSQPEPAHG